jgi:hypothetical protein
MTHGGKKGEFIWADQAIDTYKKLRFGDIPWWKFIFGGARK